MSLDDRLRRHLESEATAPLPDPLSLDEVSRRGARRRWRTRAGGAATVGALSAAVALGVVWAGNDSGTPEIDAEIAAADEDSVNEPDRPEVDVPTLEWTTATGPEGVHWVDGHAAASLDDGRILLPVDTDGPTGQALHVGDGETWEQVQLPATPSGQEGAWIARVAHDHGRTAVIRETFDPSGSQAELLVSDDLETWTVTVLEKPTEDGSPYVLTNTSAQFLAINESGVVVAAGSGFTDIDAQAVFPDADWESGAELSWYSDEDGVRLVEFIWNVDPDNFDYEAAEIEFAEAMAAFEGDPSLPMPVDPFPAPDEREIDFRSWADLGLDGPIFDNGGQPVTVWRVDGDDVSTQSLSLTPESATGESWINGLASIGDRFVIAANGFVEDGEFGERNLVAIWTSEDGQAWQRNESASAAFGNQDIFTGVGRIGDRLVIIGTCGPLPVAWVSDDAGDSWQMTDLSEFVSGNSSIDFSASGDLGVVAVFSSWPDGLDQFGGEFGEEFAAELAVLEENDVPPFSVEADGYRLDIDIPGSLVTLTDPDGNEVRTWTEGVDDGDLADTITDDLSMAITVLAPDTGEPIVTFPNETMVEGFAEATGLPTEVFSLRSDGTSVGSGGSVRAVPVPVPDPVAGPVPVPLELEESFADDVEAIPVGPPFDEGFEYRPERTILFSPDGVNFSTTDLGSALGESGFANLVVISGDRVVVAMQPEFPVIFESGDGEATAEATTYPAEEPALQWFVGTPQS